MRKKYLPILLLLILISACSTTQNSMTNNNTPTAAPAQNPVPTPVKRSNKYQKSKNGDQLMKAPSAAERVNERVENAGAIRDTL